MAKGKSPLQVAEERIADAKRTRAWKLEHSGESLTSLPESLGQLTQLQWLNLESNQLSTLPESLGQLTQLVLLIARSNNLKTLPESLRRMTWLRRLMLYRNPALGIPEEVLAKSEEPAVILDYYFSTRAKAGRAMRELKLIVVGRGGAGKTSLIKRLNGQPFDHHERETHGIVIRPLELRCFDGPVTARVWDFERASRREIEIVPVLVYPVDLKRECEELHAFNPVPAWDRCWRDYDRDGDYRDAHKPIREGLWQAIEKVRGR